MNLFAKVFNGTFIPGMDTAKDLDQSGLTGTIFTHQRVDFAGLQLEINTIQSMDTSEIFVDALHLQNRFAHSTSPFSFTACAPIKSQIPSNWDFW
jgi:hypothetical protein